jgi:hypothetical protein
MKFSFAVRGEQRHTISRKCKYNKYNNNYYNNVAGPLILNLPKIEAENIMKYENLALEIKISGSLTTYLYTP